MNPILSRAVSLKLLKRRAAAPKFQPFPMSQAELVQIVSNYLYSSPTNGPIENVRRLLKEFGYERVSHIPAERRRDFANRVRSL